MLFFLKFVREKRSAGSGVGAIIVFTVWVFWSHFDVDGTMMKSCLTCTFLCVGVLFFSLCKSQCEQKHIFLQRKKVDPQFESTGTGGVIEQEGSPTASVCVWIKEGINFLEVEKCQFSVG